MASEDGNEGLSTPKKVATGAAVGLATAAAVGVGKKLLGSNDDEDEGGGDGGTSRTSGSRGRSSTTRTSRSRSTGSSSKTRSRSKTGSRSKTRSSTSGRSGGTTRTKEQLYAQAKRLKIDGRSRMTKAQLERAVTRARS